MTQNPKATGKKEIMTNLTPQRKFLHVESKANDKSGKHLQFTGHTEVYSNDNRDNLIGKMDPDTHGEDREQSYKRTRL